MPERTDQPDPQPTPTPQLTPLYRQPATIEACAEDYAAGTEIRATMARQEARARR